MEVLIEQNLAQVRRRIRDAVLRAGRSTEEVSLLLATKTVRVEEIRKAIRAGERLIGENRVQEALRKFDQLKAEGAVWHMIGHLQTNKAKDALRFASSIESVDRMPLVEKLDSLLQGEGKSVDVLIEVNTSGEQSKFGVDPDQFLPLLRQIARYQTLKVKGLMTMGPNVQDEALIRQSFRLLRECQRRGKEENLRGVELDCLSMGMSHDFELAIEEGSTLVRLGTAIFGSRPPT
jgi:pyridoxal phosphate enzyme (YggS family)